MFFGRIPLKSKEVREALAAKRRLEIQKEAEARSKAALEQGEQIREDDVLEVWFVGAHCGTTILLPC